MLFILLLFTDPLPALAYQLAEQGDVAGLRQLNADTARPFLSQKEIAAQLKEINEAFPVEDGWEMETFMVNPHAAQIAELISNIETAEIPLCHLVATLGHLDVPFWVVNDQGVYRSIMLGTWVRTSKGLGYVSRISGDGLTYQIDGTGFEWSRPYLYDVPESLQFSLDEIRGPRTKMRIPSVGMVCYSQEEGNLEALLHFLGDQLGQEVSYINDLPGQVVGFFPALSVSESLDFLLEVANSRVPVRFGFEKARVEVKATAAEYLEWLQPKLPFALSSRNLSTEVLITISMGLNDFAEELGLVFEIGPETVCLTPGGKEAKPGSGSDPR